MICTSLDISIPLTVDVCIAMYYHFSFLNCSEEQVLIQRKGLCSGSKNCDGKWHTSNNVIIHSNNKSSYLGMISINIIDKQNYALQSKIIDIINYGIKDDEYLRLVRI